jgi:2-oxoglutarate ferredoxin oxidoreductase subunit gamma
MEIKLCGVGGQGLGFAGRLLGEAAIGMGLHVALTTAYGVESRGGHSTADVVISPDLVHFPEVRSPDALLLMAEKGLEANLRGALEKTSIIFDPGTISQKFDSPGEKRPFPFLKLALDELGNREAATLIGLGALVKLTDVVSCEALEQAVLRCLPPKVHDQNIKALRLGLNLS